MTLRGFFVTCIGVFITVLALGTEIKEFYIMALCICGLILYSLLSLILASLTLDVKSKINKAAALRGEDIKYDLSFSGFIILPVAGYLSVKSADVTDKSNRHLKHTFLMMTSLYVRRKFAFELPCAHVGAWKVGIKKLRFEDLFGLFSLPLIRASKDDFTADLAVMPKVYYIDEPEESISSGGYGNSSFSNAEEGELLGDSRLYREGDSLKRINWKQSARAKKLYSRQYEMLQKPKIVIAVDTAYVSLQMLDAVDTAFETAMTLSDYFVEELNEVELVTLRSKTGEGNRVFEIKSSNDVVKMQYDFSNIIYGKTSSPLQLDGIDDTGFLKADKIYFITDNPSQELIFNIKEMNGNGKCVRCIITKPVPTEEDLLLEESEDFVVVISSAEKIVKKAGAVL